MEHFGDDGPMKRMTFGRMRSMLAPTRVSVFYRRYGFHKHNVPPVAVIDEYQTAIEEDGVWIGELV